MITELAAQVYGKGKDNLYDRLVRAKEMQDKPVDQAVSFAWKAGDGVYPPVWVLWVEPGQDWAILYCFEDCGNESAGSMRPHTLRKTAGLCTRADLPLITALAAGKAVRSHRIVNGDRWQIDFEEPSQFDPQLWNTRILNDGANPLYHLQFNETLRTDTSLLKQETMPRTGITRGRVRLVVAVLLSLILGGVAGYGVHYVQDFDIHTRYNDTLRCLQQTQLENHSLKERISHFNEQMPVDRKRYAEICTLTQRLYKLCSGCASAPPESPLKSAGAATTSTSATAAPLFFHAVGYMFGRPPGVADYEPTLQEPYSTAGR